jgi:uncharacterized membrane protein
MSKVKVVQIFAHLAIVLWAGATWTVGYLVAPLLFARFPSERAGETMAVLLGGVFLLGLGCAMVVLLDMRVRLARQLHRQRELWLILSLILLMIAQYVGVLPAMNELRMSRQSGVDVSLAFGRLHGVSQVLYLLQSLLLLVLVYLRLPKSVRS